MQKSIIFLIVLIFIYSCDKVNLNSKMVSNLVIESNEIYLNLDTVNFIENGPGVTIQLTVKNESNDSIKIGSRNSIKSGLDTNIKYSVLLIGENVSYVLNSYFSNEFYILPRSESKITFFLNMSDVFLHENGPLPIKNINKISAAYFEKLNNIKFICLNFSKNNEISCIEKLYDFNIDKITIGNY